MNFNIPVNFKNYASLITYFIFFINVKITLLKKQIENIIWADSLNNNRSNFSENPTTIEIFNYYTIYFFITLAIFCFFSLIVAKTPVKAITSFFGVMISFVFFFFSIKTDYVGAVILMIYLGAIVIFFCFILLTMDPKKFSSFKNNNTLTISFFIVSFFFFFSFFNAFKSVIAEICSSSTYSFQNYFINNGWNFTITQSTPVHTIGTVLYTFYYIPVNILGLILFIALIGSLNIINPKTKKKRFISIIKKIQNN